MIDSNSNPDGVTYPVPGNDDAGRAITLYCDLLARAAIDGIGRAQGGAGVDIGEAEEVTEAALEEAPVELAKNGKAGAHIQSVETAKPAPAKSPAAEAAVAEGDQTSTLEALAEPQGEKDDLKKIRGITKTNEKKLNERGIFHYWQIANFTQDNLDEIDRLLHGNGQIAKGDWVDQARELTS